MAHMCRAVLVHHKICRKNIKLQAKYINVIKSVIDRNGATCQNSNRLDTQPFWTPLEMNTL